MTLNLETRGAFTREGLIDMCVDVFEVTDFEKLHASIGCHILEAILGKNYKEVYDSDEAIIYSFYKTYDNELDLLKAFFINVRDMDNGRYNQVYRRDTLPTGEVSAIAYAYEKEQGYEIRF